MHTANLSVIMPNYNHATFLPRSINAILTQTLRPREVIILDDGSTDNSLQVIEAFAARDSIIRVERSAINRGVCDRLNRGVAISRGDYILFASADDVVLPTLIEKTVPLLERYPEAGLACGDIEALNVATGDVAPYAKRWCDRECYLSPERLAACVGRTWIPSNATVFKRSSIEARRSISYRSALGVRLVSQLLRRLSRGTLFRSRSLGILAFRPPIVFVHGVPEQK